MSVFDNHGEYTHESYGMIQFNRITCGKAVPMFGSDVNTNQIIRLTITKNASCEDNDLMGRRYWSSSKTANNVVELDMTYTQFAELITCMNMGEGVPCTIKRIGGNYVPQAEEAVANVIDKEKETLSDYMKETVTFVNKCKAEIAAIMQKPSISKSDRARINSLTETIQTRITANLDFHLQKAGEAVEKLVAVAKCELSASATAAIINAGLTKVNIPGIPAPADTLDVKQITE